VYVSADGNWKRGYVGAGEYLFWGEGTVLSIFYTNSTYTSEILVENTFLSSVLKVHICNTYDRRKLLF
jgi:hypothetical protein